MSARKPHQDFAGYVAELRNPHSGGHTIISDCKRAAAEGNAIVENYKEEGGRWQVLCNEHGTLVYCTNLPVARECMKDPTSFCQICRVIAGEGPEDWERTFAPHEVEQVRARFKNTRPPKPQHREHLKRAVDILRAQGVVLNTAYSSTLQRRVTIPIMDLQQTAAVATTIMEAHARGAEMDAGFDGGEWSGPAHQDLEIEQIRALAEAGGFTVEQVLEEVQR